MFEVTDQERAAGAFAPEKLAAIRAAIDVDGYAVVAPLVSAESRDLLISSVLEDVDLIRAKDEPTPHEVRTGIGHLQLGLRRYAPYVRPDVIANPLIENAVAEVLGVGAWLGFYNGNVNCPGSTHQPVHFDRPFSWKSESEARAAGQPWPPPTTTLSCSVALTDITPESGATEVYPGTHHETEVNNWPAGERVQAHPEMIERWGPGIPMAIPAGGVCFRDPRMWHRGVPNPADTPRPMLALTYHSPLATHFRGLLVDLSEADRQRFEETGERVMDTGELGDGRLVFHDSARHAVEAHDSLHGIDRNVRFVDDPYIVNHFLDAHQVGGARVVEGGPVTPYPDA